MGRKICLLGTARPTRELVYDLEPGYEVWPMNDEYAVFDLTRLNVTRWFEIHDREAYEYAGKVGGWKRGHVGWLAKQPFPVVMLAHHEDIPNSLAFPAMEIGNRWRHYWTSTVAYALSMVCYEHFVLGDTVDELTLLGIHMATREEYIDQRPCAEYWLGKLEESVKIVLPPGCPLLSGPQYGLGNYGYVHSNMLLKQWILLREKEQTYRDALNVASGGAQVLAHLLRWQSYPGFEEASKFEQIREAAQSAVVVSNPETGVPNVIVDGKLMQ